MPIVAGAMVFIIIWWVVLFMTLPLGIKIDKNPPPGFADSAPRHSRIRKKFLLTTFITTIIWGIVEFLMINHYITLSSF
jgi:predicted secreted protein